MLTYFSNYVGEVLVDYVKLAAFQGTPGAVAAHDVLGMPGSR